MSCATDIASLNDILEIVPLPAIVLEDDGKVVFTSAGSAGVSREGNSDDQSLEERLSTYLDALAGPKPWLVFQEREITRRTQDGQAVHEKLFVRPFPNRNCIFVLDQTELGRLQLSNLQTTRLAALGFMIASVSHEISNPLASIHSIVQLMRSDSQLDRELLELGLNNISTNVKRIIEISRRLVTFSRMGDEPRTVFPIDSVIEESIKSFGQGSTYKRIVFDYSSDERAVVFANIGQMREVFVNLFVNAAQAMEGRGRITVKTCALESGAVRVTVSDEGAGIAPKLAERIFDPFFTTKPSGQGTGLGLSVSAQIVQEQGGRLWFEHKPNAGAIFHIELPRPRT